MYSSCILCTMHNTIQVECIISQLYLFLSPSFAQSLCLGVPDSFTMISPTKCRSHWEFRGVEALCFCKCIHTQYSFSRLFYTQNEICLGTVCLMLLTYVGFMMILCRWYDETHASRQASKQTNENIWTILVQYEDEELEIEYFCHFGFRRALSIYMGDRHSTHFCFIPLIWRVIHFTKKKNYHPHSIIYNDMIVVVAAAAFLFYFSDFTLHRFL